MKLKQEQRGFVLSGIALLLVLPAMLLAASCLMIVEAGGEAASLQALADKVDYTGRDIRRIINQFVDENKPIDNTTLSSLAENYRTATGLLVDIWREDNRIIENVRDPRNVARYFEEIVLA